MGQETLFLSDRYLSNETKIRGKSKGGIFDLITLTSGEFHLQDYLGPAVSDYHSLEAYLHTSLLQSLLMKRSSKISCKHKSKLSKQLFPD